MLVLLSSINRDMGSISRSSQEKINNPLMEVQHLATGFCEQMGNGKLLASSVGQDGVTAAGKGPKPRIQDLVKVWGKPMPGCCLGPVTIMQSQPLWLFALCRLDRVKLD